MLRCADTSRHHRLVTRSIAEALQSELQAYLKWLPQWSNAAWGFYSLPHSYRTFLRENNVSRKPKRANDTHTTPRNDLPTTWARITLSPQDIELAREVSETAQLFEILAEYFVGGFDITVKRNRERNNYVCFMFAPQGNGATSQLAVSAYAPTGFGSIACAIVKMRLAQSNPDLGEKDGNAGWG